MGRGTNWREGYVYLVGVDVFPGVVIAEDLGGGLPLAEALEIGVGDHEGCSELFPDFLEHYVKGKILFKFRMSF